MKKEVVLLCLATVCMCILLFFGIDAKTREHKAEEAFTEVSISKEEIKKTSAPKAKEIVHKNAAAEYIYYSNKYNIPIYVTYSLIESESEFVIKAVSRKGARYGRGLLQVSEIALKEYNDWHIEKITVEELFNVEKNLEVGLWYFNRIRCHYLKNTENYTDVYIAYNVGPSYFKNHKEELYNGIYKGMPYNVISKWEKILTKYYEYFKF